MNYELYRRSTLGLTLIDAIDELIQHQQLNSQFGMRVLHQFDRSMTEILNNHIRVRATIKGHLNVYRYLDDVWTFIVHKCIIKLDDETISADRVKIVACNFKRPDQPA